MKLHTASEIITLAKQLENESARFYEHLSIRFDKEKDDLLRFVKENKNNIVQIERAYYGVITDAIEGCFAFDIESDKYELQTTLAENTTYSDALSRAIEMEEKIIGFYSEAVEHSKSLLADVPRAFAMIVKKRKSRESSLKYLLPVKKGDG